MPRINKITETTIKNCTGVFANCKKNSEIIPGILFTVNTYTREFAAEIIINIVAEVTADESKTFFKLFADNSL